MLLTDVNVLIYAYRKNSKDHSRYLRWLDGTLRSQQAFALADVVCSGFIRIVTNRRVYADPSITDEAIAHIEDLRARPECFAIGAAERRWQIFKKLCRDADAKGVLIPDAWLGAIAIEHGCELITTDRDFSRFPGLKWRHPLD